MNMLDHALAYAARGWPLFPVHEPTGPTGCTCQDRPEPCTAHGKHPRTLHGLKDATTDTDAIRGWWRSWPTANIGLRTGVHFDVLDIDHPDPNEATAGLDTFEIVGPIARTGGGGWHHLVLPTGFGNTTRMLDLPLDWRGAGGYIVAPPSLHKSGARYEWVASPDDVDLAPCPVVLRLARIEASLREAKRSKPAETSPTPLGARTAQGSISGLVGAVERAQEGERNDVLHWAACRLGEDHRNGKVRDLRAASEALHAAAVRAGLGEHETELTILSGLRKAGAA